MRYRLWAPFAAYAFIALLAGLTLEDWRFRGSVWAVMAGLAVKTWLAADRPS